jgi:RNA polymerase sigma-54 factor
LAEADFNKLKKICGVDDDDLRDMIDEIRALNPKPASGFDYTIAQTAIADVLMKPLPKHVGGGWRVELNHETLPRVLINQEYVAIIERKSNNPDDKKFLNDKLQSANWLVQAMDQRAQSILKIASAIIEAQDGFFLFGVEFLKPLTLREIAEEVGVHESTVSRITIDKYIGTPRGLFPLKYFFGSGVSSSGSSSGGPDVAAEAIKAKIKTLIDNEDLKKILSDEAIAKSLQAEGIDIARRTVAKYREAMNIGSSSTRRRLKKNLSS